MAWNITDDDEISFPVFYHKTKMREPKFQLKMLFPTAKIFRDVVKKQTIVERRTIKQCINYGNLVRFISQVDRPWKIYASKMRMSDTYQIKFYNPKHIYTHTFHQKQINSKLIFNYYEYEIRMNPTWPLQAFLYKIVNNWNCHVSIYAIGRAKRKGLEKINDKAVDQYAKL